MDPVLGRLPVSKTALPHVRLLQWQVPGGLIYTQVASGEVHTVFLRSDGMAVACGSKMNGQRSLPALEEGLVYTQVAAGTDHTVLLRSDGMAVACGFNAAFG